MQMMLEHRRIAGAAVAEHNIKCLAPLCTGVVPISN
jgi:hypothetical protein